MDLNDGANGEGEDTSDDQKSNDVSDCGVKLVAKGLEVKWSEDGDRMSGEEEVPRGEYELGPEVAIVGEDDGDAEGNFVCEYFGA
jgi:hypothetical protein